MKAAALAVVLGSALVAAAPAAAKEPLSATVCGSSGCKTVTDRDLLYELPAGENTVALGRVAPYYRITVVAGERGGETHSFAVYYVPSANAMSWAENGAVRFHPIYGDVAPAAMRKMTAGVEPFAAPRVTGVDIGGRRVVGRAARTYLSLFTAGDESPLAESPSDWVGIDFKARHGSPWTDGKPDLVYSPSRNLIERGWQRYELPQAIAADLESGRALSAGDGSSARSRVGAGIGAGVLLLGFGVMLARRFRH